ncbi:hypothetical protein QVD17_32189 [Tagetes erecta]|uniref:Uncharacterized protein n=1 Tax=Tagetes erecta TaxID=13708 RepID=A0AAD8K5S2_TARER|nr:hypothetical protein QVD17_32189 [Tagetes erecta]
MLSNCYSSTAQSFVPSRTVNLSTIWHTNDTSIIISESNLARFSYGFTCEEQLCFNSESFFFSVYIYGKNGYDPRVVWSANPDHPVGSNATLNFTAAGELVLQDGNGSIVWTTNTTGKSVVGMNLTDIGNLVLFDDQNSVVWQSFDHPTDCWLPGQRLFEDQKLKSSVSLSNLTGEEGMYYSLQVTDKGLFAYIESNPPQAYYGMSPSRYLNYTDTHKGRRYAKYFNSTLSLYIYSTEPSDPDSATSIIPEPLSSDPDLSKPQDSTTQYMKLMPSGQLQVFAWQPGSEKWTVLIDITNMTLDNECSYPMICGRNSFCSSNQQCSCPKFEYFKPMEDDQPNMGCSEINPLNCNSMQDQVFITLKNVTYFALDPDMAGVNMETCKQVCRDNCSCKAAFFKYDSNTSSGECFLPSELFTMWKDERGRHGYSAFIKVQNVTSPPLPRRNSTVEGSSNRESHKVARVVGSTIGSFMLVLVAGIEESRHLLSVFQKCWEQGTLLDIVDISSEDMQTNATEVVKMMKIASWCLQTDYTRRPPMSSVVKVLEGGMDVESDLDYNFTHPRIQRNHSQEKDLTPLLPSVLSGPSSSDLLFKYQKN